MKRSLSLFLCLLLLLSLSAPALAAARVQISPQSLRVDGRIVNCEKYNIDGFNYIRLRDLAMLLRDTDSRFSVGYNRQYKLTQLIPGEEYTPDGSELQLIGDSSDTAAETKVTLLIGEESVDTISAYQIGSGLYFKIRDIAPYVRVKVEYDELRAMILLSTLTAAEKQYTVSELTQEADGSVSSTVSRSYDADGNLLSEVTDSADGKETHDYIYGKGGLLTGETVRVGGVQTDYAYQYDAAGNLTSAVAARSTGEVSRTDLTYDEMGRLIRETCAGSADDYQLISTYDDENLLVSTVCSFASGAVRTSDITLDIAGNAVAEAICYVAANYQSMEEIRRTFDAYGNIMSELSEFSDSDGVSRSSGFTYERDSAGNPSRCLWSDGSVTAFGQKTASELAASAADPAADAGTETGDAVTDLESSLHHVYYLNALLRSGSESIRYLGVIAASRTRDAAGSLRYIYTNRLFGCKASFTFFENDRPTMTGRYDLHERVMNGVYAFDRNVAGLEGLWLTGSEVNGISADRACGVFNTAWTDAEWADIRSLCASPDGYYLFVYDRGADGVLRARYLVPDAVNISDTCRVISLAGGPSFGTGSTAALTHTAVTLR